MFEDILDLRGILDSPKRCGPCQRDRGEEVDLEPTMAYVPSQRCYADVWECPECGFMTYRGEDPQLYDPSGDTL